MSSSGPPAGDSVARVSSVLEGERTDIGWALPEGTWVTDAFGQDLAFDTGTELVLVAEDRDLLYLAMPETRNLIMVARTNGMWNGRADVPVPEAAEDMTEAWAANPANTVVATGELSGSTPIPWWDIVIEEQPDFTYPCWLGLQCAFNTFGGDSKVHSLQGERIRSYARNDLGLGLGVHASGDPDGLERAIAVADGIAASLRPAPEPLPDAATLRFLGAESDQGLPAGQYVIPAGAHAVRLDLAEARPDTRWIVHLGGMEFSSADDVLIVAEPVLVDPDVAPSFCPPGPTSPPAGSPAYRSDETSSAGEFETYLRRFVTIESSGQGDMLGQSATWWEVGEPLPTATAECPGPSGADDVAFYLAVQEGGLPHVAGAGGSRRIYRLDDAGLTIVAESTGSSDPLVTFGPELGAMTLQ